METVTIKLKKYEYLLSCKESLQEIEKDTSKIICFIDYGSDMKKYLLRDYQKEFYNLKEINNEYYKRWQELESKLHELKNQYEKKCKICKLLKLNTK